MAQGSLTIGTIAIAGLILVVLLLSGCSSLQSYPYPACLYDSHGRYDAGQVIARRDGDDATLFQFNDTTKGDNGFRWVRPGESRTIRRCKEATLMDVESRGAGELTTPEVQR